LYKVIYKKVLQLAGNAYNGKYKLGNFLLVVIFERMKVVKGIFGSFSIQQVSDLTGISKQLIRKWEERYRIVEPKRLDNGYRNYTEQDVKKLFTIKTLLEKGHSVKQAVELLKQEINEHENPLNSQNIIQQVIWNESVAELLQHGARCDEEGITLALQHAFHHFGLDYCVKNVILPFLEEVGDRWEKGKWSEYQESFSSLIVRDFLVQIRRNMKGKMDGQLVIGACLPYERHEIPVHLLLLQLMLKGHNTMMVGASPAPGTIESLVTLLKPQYVLLSATTSIPFTEEPQLLEKLDQFALSQPQTLFYLGGASAFEAEKGVKLKAIQITNSIEEIFQ
jgi:MerR family transcriptional regulator, light-induced transcriptional regulator